MSGRQNTTIELLELVADRLHAIEGRLSGLEQRINDEPADDEPRTVADLMRVTGLGRETVRAAIRTGELPGVLVAGRYSVPAAAFHDFRHGRWVPRHRPVFSEPIRPLQQPEDLVRRRAG